MAGSTVVVKNVATKKDYLATPSAESTTSITFTVPAIEAGLYYIKVRNDPSGETNKIVATSGVDITSA